MSKNFDLPEVCSRCKKLKMSDLGRFVHARESYRRRYWVCFDCLEEKKIPRLARKCNESPPERILRQALHGYRFRAFSEYKLGQYWYDFAVPKLRTVIELDSYTYHRGQRRAKDAKKTENAEKRLWKLYRTRVEDGDSSFVNKIIIMLDKRAASIGL